MNKLVFLSVAGLCCLLVAEGAEKNKDWKDFLDELYCKEEATQEDKDHYIKCCELFPEQAKNHLWEKTGINGDMIAASDVLCKEEKLAFEMRDEMRDRKDELGLTDEVLEELRKCRKRYL